jgi:hypothetical protein
LRLSLPPLVLVALLSGCLELEGRPCSSGDDCVAGFRCASAVCVSDELPPGADSIELPETELVIVNLRGEVVVLDSDLDDEPQAALTNQEGETTVSFEGGLVEVAGSGTADLIVRTPRRFNVDAEGTDVEVVGRDGDVFIQSYGQARGSDLGGALDSTSTGSATFDVELNGDATITSNDGNIQLTVPADIDAILDAEGEEVVLENLTLSTGVNILGSAAGTIGGLVSEPQITLSAPNGIIRLIGR